MTPEPVSTATIASLGFALGAWFGAIAHRSNFCTLGAISDVVTMGDWNRLRMWGLAIAVAILGTTGLQAAGLIDTARSIYTGGRLLWLSHLVGGLLFGAGMALASGCGSKTLIRLGGGNLKSLVVALVLAVSAYMTLRGLFGVWRLRFLDAVAVDLGPTQALPALLGGPELAASIATGAGIALLVLSLASRQAWRADILAGGLGVGAAILAGWLITGHLGFVPEHPDTLEPAFIGTNSGRMESLTFVAPFAYTLELLMFWSDASKTLSFGIATALGVVAGAATHALATRSFRVEAFREADDLLRHLAGAVCMGFGGVTALGCSVGQGITGLSTLALGSLITTLAIAAGAAATLKVQFWLMMREPHTQTPPQP